MEFKDDGGMTKVPCNPNMECKDYSIESMLNVLFDGNTTYVITKAENDDRGIFDCEKFNLRL